MESRKGGEERDNGRRPGAGYGRVIGLEAVPARLRVMLVDDYASSREALAFVIERQPGMTVVAQAGTLREACGALSGLRSAPDVVVVEPELPDGEGAELLHRLRASGCKPGALVLSAHPGSARAARTVFAGARGVMHRSASLDEVVEAVRRAGRGEALLSAAEVHEISRAAGGRYAQEREERKKLDKLTGREKEILDALTRGLSDRQISEGLHITEGTVRQHVAKSLAKLEVSSRLQAALFGLRNRAS